MTSVTMKTFPTPKLESLTLIIVTPNISNPRPIFDMIAYVYSNFPSMADDGGLSGYSYYFPSYPSPFDPSGNTSVGGLVFSGVLQDRSPQDMRSLWDPLLAHINATWPGLFQVIYQPKTFPSFLGWYQENFDASQAGLNTYLGSRLLDRAALTDDLDKSARAFEGFCNGSLATAYLVSGKGVHDARPRGRDGNAVLPAWRRAYVHASMSSWPPLFGDARKRNRRQGLVANLY